MKVCSHQPSLFPWAGYWAKVAASDMIVMSCGVKMDYGGYQNRVGLGGGWLTLPVEKGSKHLPLRDVKVCPGALDAVNKRVLQELAGKRWPYRALIQDIMARVYNHPSDFLIDINLSAFWAVRDVLGIKTDVVMDWEEPEIEGSKTAKLVARIRRKAPHATVYMAGPGFSNYVNPDEWPADLKVSLQGVNKGVDTGTILQSIAQNGPEALLSLGSMFSWSPPDAPKEVYRDCAAL